MKITALQFFILGAISPLTLHAAASQPNLNGDWPTYGNGPAHTGYFPGTLTNLPFVQKWKSPLPSGALSQPAVAGGRVFVAAGYYYSPMTLRALDANNGSGVWTNSFTPASALNPPTYDSGSVFIQRAESSTDSQMYGFNATNGAGLWTAPFSSQGNKYFAPIVANGAVYADTGYYGGLTCYNRTNGAQRFFTAIIGNGCDEWTPAFYNSKVYMWVNGYFSEHDPQSGAYNFILTNATMDEFWYSMDRTVAIADGRAYFTSTTKLFCVDVAQRQNVWSITGPFSGTPAVANGVVYAITNGILNAYTTNGTYVRTYHGPAGYSSFIGQPIVTDDVVIAAGSYGVYVFRISDGAVQQYLTSQRPPYGYYYSSAIALANNTLYISSGDSNVYAMTAAGLLTFTVNGSALGAPAPYGYGTNYVLTNATVTETLPSPIAGPTGVRYVVTGWAGGGSVPPAGSTNWLSFVATNDSSLTWNCKTQYWVAATVASSGWLNVTSDWFDAGTILSLTATPSNYYHFVAWSNDLSGTSPTAQLTVNGPRQVTAQFDANLVTNNVPQWWLAYYGIPTTDGGALADADGDGFATWKEYRAGTDPTNGASALRLTMWRNYSQWVLRWPSAYGHRYRLLLSTNLNDGLFVPFATNIYAYSSLTDYYLPPPTNSAFFLLQIE